jgi:predicted regulator of Ras-like GTPase activity (Roadblock/LC7/MglB family)
MGLQGNLHDMAIADLIQHTCQDKKTARITIEHENRQTSIFFADGKIVHAESGTEQGEEVIFQVLGYEDGIFNIELGIKPPAQTVTHGWTSLLIEGARRIDESKIMPELVEKPELNEQMEGSRMGQKLDDILKDLGGEVSGYIASCVVGMDGMSAAFNATTKIDSDLVSAQMALLIKLVDTSIVKAGAGTVEDNLTSTANAYILMRHLPGKEYFLTILADRRQGSLGNMRMISKLYSDKISRLLAA